MLLLQFEKEVSRCLKVMEELEAIIARKKGVSQQVGVPLWFALRFTMTHPSYICGEFGPIGMSDLPGFFPSLSL